MLARATSCRDWTVSCTRLVYRKRLVSWHCPFVIEEGRVRDPVKWLVLMEDRDRSVSVIRNLPLAVDQTRTVTGATKPAAQGQCQPGQLALQAGGREE